MPDNFHWSTGEKSKNDYIAKQGRHISLVLLVRINYIYRISIPFPKTIKNIWRDKI